MSWRRFFQREKWDAERARELEAHLEIEAQENIARGMTAEEARYAARRKLGNVTQIREEIRRMNSIRFLDTLWQDVRYAARVLRKSPGFTAVAVLTLALGIGVNTAMFSVIDAVLLRPLPFPEPNRLVWAFGKFSQSNQAGVSPPDFLDYRSSAQTFEQFAALQGHEGFANISGGDKPELVQSVVVSWNFFDALGIRPMLGRSFEPADEQNQLPQVVILGHGIWKRDFGSDREVVGRRILVEGAWQTVVGVLPADVPTISDAEIWQAIPMLNSGAKMRTAHWLYAVGRMKRGVTLEQATADTDRVAGQLALAYPDVDKGWSLNILPLDRQIVGSVRSALLLLFGAVVLLLLIACANVANLLLARAAVRRKEVSIRVALGAGPWRIARQSLTESMLLAGAGGLLGVGLALWGIGALRWIAPADLPRLGDVRVNAGVLLFTLGISVTTGILFGLTPALQFSRRRIEEGLREGSKTSAAGMRHRLSSALVIGETAISLGLLLLGGLLIKSFWQLVHVDPGFKAERALTAKLDLPSATYKGSSPKSTFIRQLEERLVSVPGIEAAGAISELPLGGQLGDNPFTIEGRVYEPNQGEDADFRQVSSGYIAAMRIPLMAGRWFNDHDTAQSKGAIVVNEAFAKRYFGRIQEALGKRLQLLGDSFNEREIIGIIGTVQHGTLGETPQPEMYVPYAQYDFGGMNVVVRGSLEAGQIAAALRDAVASLDKQEAVASIRSMGSVVSASIAQPRFSAQLLGVFAGLALTLAAVGLYGLIAYTVAQQTREIGIRMALGAAPGGIARMVLTRGLRLVVAGGLLGCAAALTVAHLLRSMLYGVSASDPGTVAGVSGLLLVVALGACYVPARRAMRVDPMVALRYE